MSDTPDAITQLIEQSNTTSKTNVPEDFSGLNKLGFLHVSQVSELFLKSDWQLWDEFWRGIGSPRLKYGRLVLYRQADVVKFLESLIEKPKQQRWPHVPKHRMAKP